MSDEIAGDASWVLNCSLSAILLRSWATLDSRRANRVSVLDCSSVIWDLMALMFEVGSLELGISLASRAVGNFSIKVAMEVV